MKASKQIPSGLGGESVEQRQILLAEHFRENMTEDTSFEEANQYRQSFFKVVIEQANQVGFCSWSSPFEYDHPSSSWKPLQRLVVVLVPFMLFLMASYST